MRYVSILIIKILNIIKIILDAILRVFQRLEWCHPKFLKEMKHRGYTLIQADNYLERRKHLLSNAVASCITKALKELKEKRPEYIWILQMEKEIELIKPTKTWNDIKLAFNHGRVKKSLWIKWL